MKKLCLLLAVFLLCCTLAAAGRSIEVSGTLQKITNIEVLQDARGTVTDYVTAELRRCLKLATGKTIPVVKKPTPGKFTIVVGDGPVARKAGIDVKKLPAEGFYIRRAGNKLFIAGKDSETGKVGKYATGHRYFQRGTLSGMYDFLERFAGGGFFFAGEKGTVIPCRGALMLPEKINIMDSPDMSFRSFYSGRARSFDPRFNTWPLECNAHIRNRTSEKGIHFGHGLVFLKYIERFSKTHPEYFALMADGKRHCDPALPHPGQLCYTSGIREEIYQDVKACFSGKPASSRNLKSWPYQTFSGGVFCIMPQDSFYWCRCKNCAKIWDNSKPITSPEARKAISAFMFKFFAEISERLTKEGIKHKLSTMSYLPYDVVPDFKLPKELLIQVAVTGKGGTAPKDKAETAELKSWYDKTGSKVTAWTYAMGKHMSKNFPGVPAMMPRHAARFLKNNQKYLDGVFFESESDYFFFNELNYWMIGKLMWNISLDPEALLKEYFSRMFGKGAPYMAEFYADLENNWCTKILGNTVMTDIGPMTKVPAIREIWNNIYSARKIKEYNTLFDKALKAAAADKGAVERLKFVRTHLLGPIAKTADHFHQLQNGMDFWIAYCPGKVWLRPFKGEFHDVNTSISLRKEGENLIVSGECEEPRMKEIAAKCVKRDDPMTFADSSVEIFLNPSGDRVNYYQFVVNANGALTDYKCRRDSKSQIKWNSNATAKAEKLEKSWRFELTIPLKDLGKINPAGIPANFARNRAFTDGATPIYYMWTLFPGSRRGGFHSIGEWGVLKFGPKPANIVPNGNFEEIDPKTKRAKGWGYWTKKGLKYTLDKSTFISGGHSLRMEIDGTGKGNANAGCRMPGLKPNTRYRISYYLKTKDLVGKTGAGTWIYFSKTGSAALPRNRILGTNPWHRVCVEFKTPASTGKDYVPPLGLWVWNAKGTAWFDEIRIDEIK